MAGCSEILRNSSLGHSPRSAHLSRNTAQPWGAMLVDKVWGGYAFGQRGNRSYIRSQQPSSNASFEHRLGAGRYKQGPEADVLCRWLCISGGEAETMPLSALGEGVAAHDSVRPAIAQAEHAYMESRLAVSTSSACGTGAACKGAGG